jgi:hypothetical protein
MGRDGAADNTSADLEGRLELLPRTAPDQARLPGSIRPLEEGAATSLWQELVSANPAERHPMLLPRGHWIGNMTARGPNWQECWSNPKPPDAVGEFLRLQIDWPETAPAFFIWMRERAVQVPWGVFLRTWRNFLFDDEGPFLVRLQSSEFAFFGPTGTMGVGRRTPTDAFPVEKL